MMRTLEEMATSGNQAKNSPSLLKVMNQKLRIALWDSAANANTASVTRATRRRLAHPDKGFRPIQFQHESATRAAGQFVDPVRELSDLEWARYKKTQNTAGVVLKTLDRNAPQKNAPEDDKGRIGIAIPADIRIPLGEGQTTAALGYHLARFFQKKLSLYPLGLGPIPDDPEQFDRIQAKHIQGRVAGRVPQFLLEEYQKGNDGSYLPELFRHGPFCDEIRHVGGGKIVFRSKPGVPTKNPNLYHRLDCEVEMHYQAAQDRLVVDVIRVMKDVDGSEMTDIRPGDSRFLLAQRIVGSNLANLTTARAHLGICHLKIGQLFADSLRTLSPSHPIRAFLSCFAYRTNTTNSQVGLLVGDDAAQIPTGKAYSSNVLKRLLNELNDTFNIREVDPRTNAVDLGFMTESSSSTGPVFCRSTLPDETGTQVVMPYETLDQCITLFEIFLRGARQAVDALEGDHLSAMRLWYEHIARSLRGVREYGPLDSDLTTGRSRDSLARIIAVFMQTATVRHEIKGTITWTATSFLPAFPTAINRENKGGLPDIQDLFNADYVAISTQGLLPRLQDTLNNGQRIFLGLAPPLSTILNNSYLGMLEAFRKFDSDLLAKRSGVLHPFDVKFHELDSSVGI